VKERERKRELLKEQETENERQRTRDKERKRVKGRESERKRERERAVFVNHTANTGMEESRQTPCILPNEQSRAFINKHRPHKISSGKL